MDGTHGTNARCYGISYPHVDCSFPRHLSLLSLCYSCDIVPWAYCLAFFCPISLCTFVGVPSATPSFSAPDLSSGAGSFSRAAGIEHRAQSTGSRRGCSAHRFEVFLPASDRGTRHCCAPGTCPTHSAASSRAPSSTHLWLACSPISPDLRLACGSPPVPGPQATLVWAAVCPAARAGPPAPPQLCEGAGLSNGEAAPVSSTGALALCWSAATGALLPLRPPSPRVATGSDLPALGALSLGGARARAGAANQYTS